MEKTRTREGCGVRQLPLEAEVQLIVGQRAVVLADTLKATEPQPPVCTHEHALGAKVGRGHLLVSPKEMGGQ